jgi:hypothetical protein
MYKTHTSIVLPLLIGKVCRHNVMHILGYAYALLQLMLMYHPRAGRMISAEEFRCHHDINKQSDYRV